MRSPGATRQPFGTAAVVLVVGLLWSRAASSQAPPALSGDLAEGERLYRAQCGYCHGPRGEGGRGAVLARPRLRHAADDPALATVITRGIPGTLMPRSALS